VPEEFEGTPFSGRDPAAPLIETEYTGYRADDPATGCPPTTATTRWKRSSSVLSLLFVSVLEGQKGAGRDRLRTMQSR
jgi:hypothetical protein